jgi:glycosyltransferase involved in cell wall biosynthesis
MSRAQTTSDGSPRGGNASRGLRVVFDARYLNQPMSGVGNYCRNLVQELLTLEPNLQLLLITRRPGLAKQFDAGRCTDVLFRATPRSFRTLYTLPWVLRKERIDLFHGPFNLIPSGLRCPSVVTVHDVMQLQDPNNITRSRFVQSTAGLFWRRRLEHASKHATRINVVSEATKTALLRVLPHVEPARITVTPNGVEPYFFEPPSPEELTLARQLVGANPFVYCVGNESPHKNHARAVRAFLQAFEHAPEMRFVLGRRSVRHDPEMERLLAQPRSQRQVIVLDHTPLPVLRALYCEAKALFFPSWVEGFGLPVLESMACGTPVVTSTGDALREVAGDAALLADPFDVDALARALGRVVNEPDLRASLVRKGRERARAFTWRRCAEATLESYQLAMEARP